MGAGNPIIKSFDSSRYNPTTFFLDFTESYPDKDKTVKERVEDIDEEKFEDLTQDEIDTKYELICECEVASFQDDYFFNIDESEGICDWRFPNKHDMYHRELSAAYMGTAIVLAMNDDTLILTTDEAELHHYPLGVIPNFKYDEICEEMWEIHSHKEDWYESRGRDFNDRINELAEKEYDKRLEKWKNKYEPFMRMFHKHWGNIMSIRNGAWQSTSIKTIGETYKFL